MLPVSNDQRSGWIKPSNVPVIRTILHLSATWRHRTNIVGIDLGSEVDSEGVASRRSAVDLATVALTAWLGVHALRTFFSMVVWNIGRDRSPNELGLIAFGLWIIGLLAWPAARWLGGTRPEVRFGLLFSLLYIANQFTTLYVLAPFLGVATAVLWLWFLPAMILALGRRGHSGALIPGILLGLAAQVALQTALHGVDLPMLHGIVPGLGALGLGGLLFIALRRGAMSPSQTATFPGWGLVALGPYLMLQFTLLIHGGRVQTLAHWSLLPASSLVLLGLVASCAVLGATIPYAVRVGVAAVAVALVAWPSLLTGPGVWLLPVAQISASMILASAFSTTRESRPDRVYAWSLVAALLFLVFLFLYYSRFGWHELWPAMAALIVLPALARTGPVIVIGARRAAAASLIVGVVGLGVHVTGQRPAVASASLAPAELKILTYNIDEMFNVWGMPDPEAVVRVIENAGADLVGLQEVGRGWDVNGGPDLVAWLQWRLPQYHVVFAPMLGDLVGDVILSRYPIGQAGWLWYPARTSRFHYGLTWATVPTAAGDLFFINTHLSPYAGFEDDRTGQAGDLLTFWNGRPRTVIVGDINAPPDEKAVRRLLSAGLVDVPGAHGLGTTFTASSLRPSERIDYVFSTPDIASLEVTVRQSTASDHLPVEARVRLP